MFLYFGVSAIPQYTYRSSKVKKLTLNRKIILMAPAKIIRFYEYQIQTERSDVHVVGPLVLRLARSNPGMIIEFLSIYERKNLLLSNFFLWDFYIRHKIQFRDLYRDMNYATLSGGFLVTTANTGESNNLVDFSVKPVPSLYSSMLAEEQSEDTESVVKIIVPSIWDLHEQSDSMVPFLDDFTIEEIKRCRSDETSLDGSRFSGVRFYSLSSPPMFRDRFPTQTPSEADNWPSHILNISSLSEYASSGNREVNKPLFNRARLSEVFLMIAAQTGLSSWAIGSNGIASLSHNARILLYSAVSCNAIGFLCFLYGILVFGLREPGGLAARISTGIGYTASVCGFLALPGMLLPENVMLEITFAVCVVSFPALAHTFMKKFN